MAAWKLPLPRAYTWCCWFCLPFLSRSELWNNQPEDSLLMLTLEGEGRGKKREGEGEGQRVRQHWSPYSCLPWHEIYFMQEAHFSFWVTQQTKSWKRWGLGRRWWQLSSLHSGHKGPVYQKSSEDYPPPSCMQIWRQKTQSLSETFPNSTHRWWGPRSPILSENYL